MLVITHPNLSGKVELAEDEIVALLGKNGSGKTTLINSIMCDQGKIILDQRDFCSNRDYSVLSAVFQEPRSQILANTLEDELRIMSLYHQVNFEIGRKLMGKYFTHDFFKLSDGFKKRFVISSILSNSPRYVLLDEPLSNLDEAGIKLVTEIIPQGSLVAEHRTGHIMNLANKIYLISEGVVREIDRDKLSDPDFLRKNGLRGFKLESSGGNPGEEILDVNVGIRIKVREREVVCLVGPNGSGKTTTLKKLSGKIYAIFQNPDLQFFRETVEKEVKSPEAITTFGLDRIKDRNPFTLSTGEKMRTLIASAYASGHRVIGLDEPTTAMDGEGLLAFAKMVDMLREERRGLILATHDKDILPLCDKVISLGQT